MSEFFTNLLDRHLGSCNVVEPRGSSRFEGESVGSAIPLSINHLGKDETGDENLERRDSVVRILEDHAVVPPFSPIESQRIDPELKLSVDHTGPVHARNDHLESHGNLIRPPVNDSISADLNAPEMKPLLGTPVLRQQNRKSTAITENQPALPGDLPNRISGTNPTAEAHASTSELNYRFEGKLENRFKTMLARLQDQQNLRPAEHAEMDNLDRSVVTKPNSADDTEKDLGFQQLLLAPLSDESAKVVSSNSDQEQPHAFALDKPDSSQNGLLEPPTGFSDVLAEFNRRWNELHSESKPEPVINVTIGRVEVRAVQVDTPQKTRRKRKPSSVMSLDDYLNRRERRGTS